MPDTGTIIQNFKRFFEYSDPTTVAMCSADMQRAIQKASKVHFIKSITAKPEQKPMQFLLKRMKNF